MSEGIFIWQCVDKPGSVVDDHLSSCIVADTVKRIKRSASRATSIADLLATDRVYLHHMSPCVAVVSYTTPFTLTCRSRRYRFCGTFPRVAPGRR